MIFGLLVMIRLVRVVMEERHPMVVGSVPANDVPLSLMAMMWLFPLSHVMPFQLRGKENRMG